LAVRNARSAIINGQAAAAAHGLLKKLQFLQIDSMLKQATESGHGLLKKFPFVRAGLLSKNKWI
jgi:hypothetical protein